MAFKIKRHFLAAASAVAVATAPAAAAVIDTAPTQIVAAAATDAPATADEPAALVTPKRMILGASAMAVLAALIKLTGFRAIQDTISAAAPVVAQAAKTAAKAPAAAARAVGKTLKSPMRTAFMALGLAMFALTGVGLYDIEWLGGMAVGVALTWLGWSTSTKVRSAMAPARAPSKPRNESR